VVAGLLAIITVGFFPDVVFFGRTVQTSSLGSGVNGIVPYGYPAGTPKHNPYLFDPQASRDGSEPMIELVSRSLRSGRAPLWDRDVGFGHPLLAGWSTDAVSPLRVGPILLSSPGTWEIYLLARLVTAGLLTYVLARILGISRVASFGAAVGYAFSGYFMFYINMLHADFAMMLPAVVLTVELLMQRPRARRILVAAATLALACLSDNPETALLAIGLAIGYGVLRAISLRRDGDALRRLRALGIVIVAGLALCGFVLFPFTELAGFGGTGGSVVSRHVAGSNIGLRHYPWGTFSTFFFPFLRGATVQIVNGHGRTMSMTTYGGIVLSFLTFLGLFRARAFKSYGWIFAVIGGLVLAKVFGVPIVNSVGRLPSLNALAFPTYITPVISLCLAFLAAIGIDHIVSGEARARHVGIAAGLLLVLAGAMILLDRNSGFHHYWRPIAIGALALVFVIAAIALFKDPRARATAVIVVLLGELWTFTAPLKPVVGKAFTLGAPGSELPVIARPRRYDPFTPPPFVSYLKEDKTVFRVLGLSGLLYPDTSQAFDIQDIRSFEASPLERYYRFMTTFFEHTPGTIHMVGIPPTVLRPGASITPGWALDLLNVKYIVAPSATDFDPALYAATPAGDVSVLRNKDVLPRAFMVRGVIPAEDEESAVEAMKATSFDPAKQAVVEGTIPADQLEQIIGSPQRSKTAVIQKPDGDLRITVSSDAAGLLVVSDAYYKDWRATVDGKPTHIYPTDVAFRSIFVPAGIHQVSFTYRATSFKSGLAVSALTLILLVGAAAWEAIRERGPVEAVTDA